MSTLYLTWCQNRVARFVAFNAAQKTELKELCNLGFETFLYTMPLHWS